MVALTPTTAKALGMEISEEDAKRTYVEMSGRKGFGVKADDMLDELERKATEAVLTNARGPRCGTGGRDRTAGVGGRAALLHAALRPKQSPSPSTSMEALRFEGDSGPYLQYSTVRVQNIFRKMKERGRSIRASAIRPWTI